MPRPQFRLAPSFCVLSVALGLTACDKGGGEETTPPPKAEAPASTEPTHDVVLPTPEEVCQHILDVAHTELGHVEEMNTDTEAAAVAECAERIRTDRTKYGVAFAPIPECVFLAEELSEIAECEDHYARDLVDDDAHAAITEFSLEEPIVDAELCMHWAFVATGKEVDTKECRDELIKVREHVGNVIFDRFAKCMMDSADEAEFFECRTKADEHVEERTSERPEEARVIPDATPADALEMLLTIERQACGCEDVGCAHAARDALDMWVIAYADAGGNEEETMKAERLIGSFVQCEIKVAGGHWVED